MTAGPQRGDLYMAHLDPTVGHEQGGYRPVLIASIDQMNRAAANLVIIIPVSTTPRENPFHVRLEPGGSGLERASYAMSEMVRSVSKTRLRRKIGRAPLDAVELATKNAGILIGLGRTKF
jgi:mRNA interferase MazF